jgi:hypothetical protein
MEDRVDRTMEQELRDYLSARLDRIPVLSTPRFDRGGGGWLSRAAMVPTALLLVSAALVGGSALNNWREQRIAAPGVSATPSANAAATPTSGIAPSPSASVRPIPQTSRELGETLARTFEARDADAIASLLAQGLGVSAVVEPFQQGDPLSEGCCVLNVLAVDFVERLRDRFASGAITVIVDPQVQTRIEGGRERSFVRSDWREPDRTVRIDLFLDVVNGRWYWSAALHHYQRTQLTQDKSGVACIPYRSPWVSTTSSC